MNQTTLRLKQKAYENLELFAQFEEFLKDRDACKGYESWLDTLPQIVTKVTNVSAMTDSQNYIMTRTLRRKGVLEPKEFVTNYSIEHGKLFIEVSTGHELVLNDRLEVIKVNSLKGANK